MKDISVIMPARNEAHGIGAALASVLESAALFLGVKPEVLHLDGSRVEVLVVNNRSSDRTREIVELYARGHGVECFDCERLRAPCARNFGVRFARGHIYVFVDADTAIPAAGLQRVFQLVTQHDYEAGIFALCGHEDTLNSRCWWGFWNLVRLLPLARAKALPAFMFCTRTAFDRFGPFDESVQIGEEWPILAGLYRHNPRRLIYDRTLTARTSNRRMTLQHFGYAKTFFKYVWAVLHASGRNRYPDTFRD